MVILKLMQAQFYVEDPTSKVAIVAYLTYSGFLVFSAVAGLYFSENNIKKNTFLAGLLAPSILLTFFAAPNFNPHSIHTDPVRSIPRISLDIIPSAHAQAQAQINPKPAQDIPIEKIFRSTLESDYKNAFLQALGRPSDDSKYLFVIGATPDLEKAKSAARSVRILYGTLKIDLTERLYTQNPVKIIEVDGNLDYFVTLGGLRTLADLENQKKIIVTSIFDADAEAMDPPSRQASRSLLRGVVVDARELLPRRH